MSSRPTDCETEVRRLAEASVWRVRLSEAGLESSAEFEAWLASDPTHPAAWTRVQAPWNATDENSTGPEIMAARRDALDRARRAGRRQWRGSYPSWLLGTVAATAAAVCLTATVLLILSQGWGRELQYRTSLDQRQTFTLPDGSRAVLDAGTEIHVRYSHDTRRIHLLRGQARFQVAHNIARPFSVQAAGEVVVAVGTDFNVDLLESQVTVTLIKGRVTVAPAGSNHAPPVILYPGQQLVASPAQPVQVESANIASAMAWESGLLVFDDEPLGTVVTIVSRYGEHPVIASPEVSALQMSGVFKEGDVTTFIDVVTHYLPVTASEGADGTITLHRKR